MTAASATNGYFDKTASELKKIRNVKTPSGAVMRVTATDLKWFNHFYTFTTQGNECFQGMETLAREMGISSISTVQDRINKLVTLGFLTVEKKKTAQGWVNSYPTTPVDIIVSMMTDESVTKQQKMLKKSQLKSYVNKSAGIDRQRRINNMKAAARAAGAGELTDDEAIDFALSAAEVNLSLLGWDSEVYSDVAEEINEHANDSPVQNDGYQSSDDQDQVANDCRVVGNPVVTASVGGTAFTSVFAVVPVIEDAFSFPEVKPATSETWLDAPFTPHGELIPEAVQHCFEKGVTDPEEQKDFVRKLADPDYVRPKPIYNPTPAAAPEWEELPF
ncbi:hypothetical protein B194_2877 [Serratia plymuthica A30]|uniref:helix-turn-helix domain-containing protein n=1 Tax=Serratia plymuthica TaxID=82996 RepID=UPI0002A24A37|nr:helix-turn-helix domain-containing protein [Serratia plymuthica]EKF64148.1 hypothetical protein B194_2877 [Serratia plymuthica A30]